LFVFSGITVASPTDVVKVRLQAEGRLPPGQPRRYAGAIDAYRKIVAEEGIKGLWTGYGPNLARNCVVNATELVAYDQVNRYIYKQNTKNQNQNQNKNKFKKKHFVELFSLMFFCSVCIFLICRLNKYI
jgi:hypothetical protein